MKANSKNPSQINEKKVSGTKKENKNATKKENKPLPATFDFSKIKTLKQVRLAQSFILSHPSNNPFKDTNLLTALRDLRTTILEEAKLKKEIGSTKDSVSINVSFVSPGEAERERIEKAEDKIKKQFGLSESGKRN